MSHQPVATNAGDMRSRASFLRRTGQIRLLLADNGFRWMACFALRKVFKGNAGLFDDYMRKLEARYHLPGNNGIRRNYEKWQNYDWRQGGEEWTVSEQWKQSLIDEVLLKQIPPGKDVLEIGPGAGRWTEVLQQRARTLSVVDVSDKCIELCRERFTGCSNVRFFVNDGYSLSFIPDESIDCIWSFDVFVHIAPRDVEGYVVEFARILREGARGIVHHANEAAPEEAWRSRLTGQLFAKMLQNFGLVVKEQFDRWGGGEGFKVGGDLITVFEKQLD